MLLINMNNLILGDGLLGSELHKQTGWHYISRKKDGIDFCDLYSYAHMLNGYDTIINCIAYTKTYSEERQRHWDTNFVAVCDLVDYLNKKEKKFCHISTDYVYAGSKENASEEDIPVPARNWYSVTKLLGDGYVQARAKNYLLIRTSFKPYPFPYEKAITTQIGSFDYVDVIAYFVIDLIEGHATGLYNVGTDTKTIWDLAILTSNPIKSNNIIHESMPTNVSMNCDKLNIFLHTRR